MTTQNETIQIGIDIGTKYCRAAYIDTNDNKSQIRRFKDEKNEDVFPSLVNVLQTKILVGSSAKEKSSEKNLISNIKRFIGKYNDSNDEQLNELIKSQQVTICEIEPFNENNNLNDSQDDNNNENETNEFNDNKPIGFEIVFKQTREHQDERMVLSPEQLITFLLFKIKDTVEKELKCSDKQIECVVGVPVTFGNEERKQMERAIQMSGMKIIQLINEPTAIAYTLNDVEGNVLVVDFGAGFVNVSLFQIKGKQVTVGKTYGDNYIGGNDIDTIILKI